MRNGNVQTPILCEPAGSVEGGCGRPSRKSPKTRVAILGFFGHFNSSVSRGCPELRTNLLWFLMQKKNELVRSEFNNGNRSYVPSLASILSCLFLRRSGDLLTKAKETDEISHDPEVNA